MDSDIKVKLSQNPRVNASIFKILTFSWMLNLFKIGKSRDLEENDLYVTLKEHASSTLGDELEKNWRLELANAFKEIRNPSLLRALIKMFGVKYISYGFLIFIDEIIFKMSKPLFIGGLLTHFNSEESENTEQWYAFMCATGLGFSILATILLTHSTITEICHIGMKMRVACSSIIFRKALRLSHSALRETTVGQVINLLSNDVNRFDRGLFFFHYLWIGPLQTIVVMYFLWQEIGVSSLLGVAFLFIFIPLQGWLGKKVFEIRLKSAKRTDERGQLINEIIMGIQAIKMYTWEKPFEQLIKYARKKEIQHIRGITTISAVSFLYKGVQIKFQLFACILSYVLLENYITSKKVFVLISLYNLLQNSMSMYFFLGISQISEILVSIKRIQNFLLLEENNGIMTKSITRIPNTVKNGEKCVVNTEKNMINKKNNFELQQTIGIDVLNVTAKWSEYQNSNTLENINLAIRPGQLVAIIGPVGAGKSSLIQLILGELPASEGSISVRGVVSYASQEPWLFTGSVQQNILFNSPMNRNRYKKILKLCALQRDFEQFPYGDRTIVGERGLTLSGGQKSRINLARAIYKEADIYLLDDPLSAVDSRVGRYLYEKCIRNYLRDKICILVTHQIQFLTNINQIVLMEKAKILAYGSQQELRTSGIDFARFLRFSEEINAGSDVNAKNISNNDISILCSQESNESLSSCVDESKFSEILNEPNQVAEFRSSGKISKNVYKSYVSAVGSTCNVFLFFFMFILTQSLISGEDYWTSFWVNKEDHVFKNNNKIYDDNNTLINRNSTDFSSTDFRETCILVYITLNTLLIVSLCVGSTIFVSVCTKASFNLHNMMFDAIIRAKMYFFNSNSSGRILNRFTNDIGSVDTILPIILIDCLQLGMKILGVVIIVGIINFYLLIPTIIIGAICFLIRSFFLPTTRSIKRLERVARSPILAYLNASIQGLKTIRAYEAEQTICNEFDKNLDSHSSAWYIFICSNGAFGLWLDLVCFIYICILIFFLVFSNTTYGSYVGLAITQTISLVGLFQWTIKQCAEFENHMSSVERIFEYINSPREADFLSPSDKIPPENWPNAGKIVFQNLNLYFSPDSPSILKNLNFQIQSMEKIGIVGRTGAGKSSIISAIFRLAQNEGNIIIDEIEIHELGLYDLRSKLSVIPQEPVLFSGTIRKNLDPFDKYPDHVLWNALDEVRLKVTIAALPGCLNSKISECGSNFSVGQKQLLCLARALVQNNKILILDEATANVDAQTDALIQNTIRNKFRSCTVLTVAHRLHTVMDSDRVLVMDSGSVVEFDHPHVLLKNKDGFLYSMVEQTGVAASKLLRSLAATSYKNIQKKRKSYNEFIEDNV